MTGASKIILGETFINNIKKIDTHIENKKLNKSPVKVSD